MLRSTASTSPCGATSGAAQELLTSTGPEVEDVLAWRQSSALDDLLDHWDKALISLTLIDPPIAIPYPALPHYSFNDRDRLVGSCHTSLLSRQGNFDELA